MMRRKPCPRPCDHEPGACRGAKKAAPHYSPQGRSISAWSYGLDPAATQPCGGLRDRYLSSDTHLLHFPVRRDQRVPGKLPVRGARELSGSPGADGVLGRDTAYRLLHPLHDPARSGARHTSWVAAQRRIQGTVVAQVHRDPPVGLANGRKWSDVALDTEPRIRCFKCLTHPAPHNPLVPLMARNTMDGPQHGGRG